MTQQHTDTIRMAILEAIASADGRFCATADLGDYEIDFTGYATQEGHWDGRTWYEPGSWVLDELYITLDEVTALSNIDDEPDDSPTCMRLEAQAWDIAQEAIEEFRSEQDFSRSHSRHYWHEYA